LTIHRPKAAPSRVIVTYACGHGARVSSDLLLQRRDEILQGLRCPACQVTGDTDTRPNSP